MIDLNKATSQEVFDYVIDHLRKQGRRAYDRELGKCLYLADDGAKCAVGCLIPGDVYSPHMENKTIEMLLLGRPYDDEPKRAIRKIERNLRKLGFNRHADLLFHLQNLHDQTTAWDSPQEFDNQAYAIADRFILTLKERPAQCS